MATPLVPLYNHTVTLNLDGTPLANIETTDLTEESSEEDCMVVADQGAYNFVGDVHMFSFNFQVFVDPDSAVSLDVNVDYDTSAWGHTGWKSYAGKVRLLSLNPSGGAKGLVRLSGRGKFRGAVTKT